MTTAIQTGIGHDVPFIKNASDKGKKQQENQTDKTEHKLISQKGKGAAGLRPLG
jgi:hypothetical protein